MFFPSLILMARNEEQVRELERRAMQQIWWPHQRGRAGARRTLSAHAKARFGKAGLLVAGAKS
jgi:hypothetical protein